MTHTLFISDLHLHEGTPETNQWFFDFMEELAPKADALYILGDFYEAWVGHDDRNPLHDRIDDCLKSINIPLFFMRGNRDLLIDQTWANHVNAQLLADPSVITLYGQKLLLAHGDLLCWDDKNHLRFRKLASSRITQAIFRALPLSLRQKIASKLRQQSGKHYQKNQRFIDLHPEAIAEAMQKHQVNLMIHGHTHEGKIHPLTIEDKAATRIVLDDWHQHGSALRFNDDGSYSLIKS